MIVYKITNENMMTRNKTKWVLREWKEIAEKRKGKGGLCTKAVFHAYSSAQQAVLHYKDHVGFRHIRLFKAETPAVVCVGHDKVGVEKLRLLKEIKVPKLSKRWVVRAILKQYPEASPIFQVWLDGKMSTAEIHAIFFSEYWSLEYNILQIITASNSKDIEFFACKLI